MKMFLYPEEFWYVANALSIHAHWPSTHIYISGRREKAKKKPYQVMHANRTIKRQTFEKWHAAIKYMTCYVFWECAEKLRRFLEEDVHSVIPQPLPHCGEGVALLVFVLYSTNAQINSLFSIYTGVFTSTALTDFCRLCGHVQTILDWHVSHFPVSAVAIFRTAHHFTPISIIINSTLTPTSLGMPC